MVGFGDFARKLANPWDLPSVVGNDAGLGIAMLPLHLLVLVTKPPPLLHNAKEKSWESYARRLWVQVDNQEAANAFAGMSYLKVLGLQPLCIRRFKGKVPKLSDSYWNMVGCLCRLRCS